MFQTYREQIVACDREIECLLKSFEPRVDPEQTPLPTNGKQAPKTKRAGSITFDYRTEAYKIFGIDVTRIPGIDGIAMALFSEIGRDLSRFPTKAHFTSWLGLCPDNDKSGGRVLWTGVRHIQQRAGQLFRLAAHSLHRHQSRLGDFLRRMKSKLGPKAATTAAAHKLAGIFYTLVTQQIEYDESIQSIQDEEATKRLENKVKRQAARLGFQLTPMEVVPQ